MKPNRSHILTEPDGPHHTAIYRISDALGDAIDKITSREILDWNRSRRSIKRIKIKLRKARSKMKVSESLLVEFFRKAKDAYRQQFALQRIGMRQINS